MKRGAKPELFEWTEGREQVLRDLHAAGKSYAMIAAALGHKVTRNAISGKVMRLGLPSRGLGNANKPKRHRLTKKLGAAVHTFGPRLAASEPDPVLAEAGVPGGVDFETASDQCLCAWAINSTPLGRADDLRFCGGPRVEGRRYCEAHFEASYDRARTARAKRQTRSAISKAKREGVA